MTYIRHNTVTANGERSTCSKLW